MISFLIILTFVSVFFYGFGIKALIPVIVTVLTTTILDILIEYFKSKTFVFPQSALISGLLMGGLLTQDLKWYIYVLAGIIAIASKHMIRFNQKHVFNPANLGVLLVSIFLGASHSWWISSPIILVLVFGIFIVWRLKRFDLTLIFLIGYYLLNSVVELLKSNSFNDIYSTIINGGIIYFFSMYMLIEPKTNPSQRKQRIVYGIFVAILFVIFSQYPFFYKSAIATFFERHSLPLALAVGNVFVLVLNRRRFEFKKGTVQTT